MHRRRLAAKLWPAYSWAVDSVNANARLARWHRDYLTGPHFDTRFEMHKYVCDAGSEPLDYLEFGVYRGASIKYWSQMAVDPASRFFGFDTFTGLPEKWELGPRSMEAGHFAVDQLPAVDDQRVTLIKGLFQDTLDDFLATYRRNGRMVIHCDADLYSSTLYLLSRLAPVLQPGDAIIFDEFSQPLHEFRALIDWAQAYRVDYAGLASAEEYHRQVAITIK